MIVRYFEIDWHIPAKTNDFLFQGTAEQCADYILKNWSVDYYEMRDKPDLRDMMLRDLEHIQIGFVINPNHYSDARIQEMWEEGNDRWDGLVSWTNIDPQDYIFNENLLEVY